MTPLSSCENTPYVAFFYRCFVSRHYLHSSRHARSGTAEVLCNLQLLRLYFVARKSGITEFNMRWSLMDMGLDCFFISFYPAFPSFPFNIPSFSLSISLFYHVSCLSGVTGWSCSLGLSFLFTPFASASSYHDIFQLLFCMISLLHAESSTFEPFSFFYHAAFDCVQAGQFNSEAEIFLVFFPSFCNLLTSSRLARLTLISII